MKNDELKCLFYRKFKIARSRVKDKKMTNCQNYVFGHEKLVVRRKSWPVKESRLSPIGVGTGRKKGFKANWSLMNKSKE
jgi:hypothetical protein